MNEILPYLFQGHKADAIFQSQNNDLDVIIYLGQELNERCLTHNSKIPVIHFPLNDGKNDEKRYTILNGIISYLININGFDVLVACRYGESRSPAIMISYLMYSEKYIFALALQYVRRRIDGFKPCEELLSDISQLSW